MKRPTSDWRNALCIVKIPTTYTLRTAASRDRNQSSVVRLWGIYIGHGLWSSPNQWIQKREYVQDREEKKKVSLFILTWFISACFKCVYIIYYNVNRMNLTCNVYRLPWIWTCLNVHVETVYQVYRKNVEMYIYKTGSSPLLPYYTAYIQSFKNFFTLFIFRIWLWLSCTKTIF